MVIQVPAALSVGRISLWKEHILVFTGPSTSYMHQPSSSPALYLSAAQIEPLEAGSAWARMAGKTLCSEPSEGLQFQALSLELGVKSCGRLKKVMEGSGHDPMWAERAWGWEERRGSHGGCWSQDWGREGDCRWLHGCRHFAGSAWDVLGLPLAPASSISATNGP